MTDQTNRFRRPLWLSGTYSAGIVSCIALTAMLAMLIGLQRTNADIAPQEQVIDTCGTIVLDKLYYCYLFQSDDDGMVYAVDGLIDQYYPGQRIHVQGVVYDCASFCTIDGCITPTDITACAAECPADLNGDGVVDVLDMLIVLEAWGSCYETPCSEDLNGDGVVDVLDLLILLEAWGPCA